jgi:hypothetical protein
MVSDQIAYRATHYVDALSKRDRPSMAAKFAMIRYLALMKDARNEVFKTFTERELHVIFSEFLPTLDLQREDVIDMLGAWARRNPSVSGEIAIAEKLDQASLLTKDALVDYWRANFNGK